MYSLHCRREGDEEGEGVRRGRVDEEGEGDEERCGIQPKHLVV